MDLCYLAESHKAHDVPKCGVTPRHLRSIPSLQQRLELLSSTEEDHWGLCLSLANDLMQKCDKPLDVFASNQGYDFFLATSAMDCLVLVYPETGFVSTVIIET